MAGRSFKMCLSIHKTYKTEGKEESNFYLLSLKNVENGEHILKFSVNMLYLLARIKAKRKGCEQKSKQIAFKIPLKIH